MIKPLLTAASLLALGLTTACSHVTMPHFFDEADAVKMEAKKEEASTAIADAVAHPERPAEEVERDESRLPAETLEFAGLMPGMKVLELEAGGGYYTEIMSRAVGPKGQIVMQNPPSFDGFLGDALDKRLGESRLPNVRVMRTNFDNLDAADNTFDLVTWIQGPHELWFEVNGATLGDPETTFEEIARVLKPGGALLVVDHIAVDGAGTEAGGTVHRIEQSVIEELAGDAGLTLDRTSDILIRDFDPLTNNVFDPEIRGKTSQFVAVFIK